MFNFFSIHELFVNFIFPLSKDIIVAILTYCIIHIIKKNLKNVDI